MTNAEIIIDGLQKIDNDYDAESIAYYINCPSSEDCTYDGNDNTPCCDCKIKWLRSNWCKIKWLRGNWED
jgi:hypothetical protein